MPKVACTSCQRRKQKCEGGNPCFRCVKLGKICSFSNMAKQTNLVFPETDNKIDAILSLLQNLDQRISEVELQRVGSDGDELVSNREIQTDSPPTDVSSDDASSSSGHSSHGAISQMSLNMSPMMAIKNIMRRDEPAQIQKNAKMKSPLPFLKSLNVHRNFWTFDPVSLKIISLTQAQRLVDIYFQSCHPMAPLITKELFQDAEVVRNQSTLLFLTILSVACRYASFSLINSSVHSDIILLLDYLISQTVLYSTEEAGAELEVMEAFQIYAHWMPSSKTIPFGKRTAWNMIGLAIRCSKGIDLEHKVTSAFSNLNSSPTKADFRNLRVLLNLVSLDYQFMLSSRRPVSIDPSRFVPIGKKYMLHPNSDPEDVKLVALSELALIFHSAFDQSGICGKLDWTSLSVLNFRLDEWESQWRSIFDAQPLLTLNLAQIPFTSLRWYRLALNTLPLSLLFSADNAVPSLNNHGLECLNRSIISAAEMLACFLTHLDKPSLQLDRRDFVGGKWTNYSINLDLISQFRFSIDSYWISHVFAIAFLCVLYSRGIINDNCECLITIENVTAFSPTPLPVEPDSSSLLLKLLDVGKELYSQSKKNYDGNSWWPHPLCGLTELVKDIHCSMTQRSHVSYSSVNEIFEIPMNMVVDWDSILETCTTPVFG